MKRKQRALELFEQAFDMSPDDFQKFADQACIDDPRLRQQLLALQAARTTVEADEITRETPITDKSASSDYRHGQFLPGTSIGQRYRIVSLVGSGAMGEVYHADDLRLGHAVALKILPREIADDRQRREYFHREVRLARQISHPNVCRVYDIGDFDKQHFLSMEYVDGEDLKTLLHRIGRLPPDKGVEIAQQICVGLAAAHDQQVIHRDLKPANIMIDGQGQVRITDFGLARTIDEQAPTEFVGTPSYMAPEQLSAGVADIRTDVYSLGLVLHELFTGQPVFRASSLDELRKLHQQGAEIHASTDASDLSPLVKGAIASCLETEPENRPGSAREVAALLPGGEPLAAALAAGHTPSPAQVAASGGAGPQSVRAATWTLAAVALGLILVLVSSPLTAINRAQLEKHPQVLLRQARDLAQRFGYNDDVDSAWGFELARHAAASARNPESVDEDGRDDVGKDVHLRRIKFWYRQSPSALAPISLRDGIRRNPGRVTFYDPPLTTGMARLRLNAQGELLSFEGVPRTRIKGTTQSAQHLREAAVAAIPSLAEQTLTQQHDGHDDEPQVPFDQQVTWSFTRADGTPANLAIASQGHHVVDFRIGSEATGAARAPSAISRQSVLYLVILVAASLASGYHYHMGLGDRLGAKRLAQLMFFGHLAIFALVGSHTLESLVEAPLVQQGVALAAFTALEIWVYYMALEPLARRRLPRNLVSWYRALAGRWQDPLVGQRVLLGVVAAIGLRLSHPLCTLVAETWDQVAPAPLQMTVWPLSGTADSMARVIADLLFSVKLGLTYLLSLSVLVWVLRRPRWAGLGFVILWTTAFMEHGGMSPVGVTFLAIAMAVKVTVLIHFGLLSVITILFVERLLEWPITLDSSAWYFSTGLFGLLLVVGIALVAYVTSIGGMSRFASREVHRRSAHAT